MAPWGKCVTLSNLIPITNHSDDLGVFFFSMLAVLSSTVVCCYSSKKLVHSWFVM